VLSSRFSKPTIGSKADIKINGMNVRFATKSRYWRSDYRCPRSAKGRHSGCFWILLLVAKGAQVRGASPKLPRRQFLHLAAGAAALSVLSGIARAQAYPSRPIRWVVGFAPGGATDIIARLMGQWLSERLGQSVVIENRPGAGSNLATEVVVNSPPDGYTLLLVGPSHAVNATLYPKLNYNFIRDIAPIASISREPRFLPRRSLNSLPMPRPIRASSIWRRPALEPRSTSAASCSR